MNQVSHDDALLLPPLPSPPPPPPSRVRRPVRRPVPGGELRRDQKEGRILSKEKLETKNHDYAEEPASIPGRSSHAITILVHMTLSEGGLWSGGIPSDLILDSHTACARHYGFGTQKSEWQAFKVNQFGYASDIAKSLVGSIKLVLSK